MDFKTIMVEKRPDRLGMIALSRQEKRNAISIQMRQEISTILDAWRGNPDVGAVIFTGSGDAFSAGFDLDEFKEPARFEELFQSSAHYHRDLWSFPKPTLAAVNGPALGGGFDLAVLCDIRLCGPSAVFGHPEVKLGAPPIFSPLAWIVGAGRAREICLTGRKVDAVEAHRIGLVSELTSSGGLLQRAVQIALTVLEAPEATLHFAKRFMNESVGKGFAAAFTEEHDRAFQNFLLPGIEGKGKQC